MTTKTAQNKSAYSQPKTVAGHKVYPAAYGHINWIVGRKNPVMTGKGAVDDYALAEICFAFTQEPKSLQNITGANAKKRANDLLVESSPKTLIELWTYAAEQIEIYHKTLSFPKKAPAQSKNRKTANPARKR